MKNLKVPPARIDAETYNKLVDMRKKLSQDTGAYVSESEIVCQALDYYREWRKAGNSAIPRTTAPLEQRLTLVWVDDGLMQFVDQTPLWTTTFSITQRSPDSQRPRLHEGTEFEF